VSGAAWWYDSPGGVVELGHLPLPPGSHGSVKVHITADEAEAREWEVSLRAGRLPAIAKRAPVEAPSPPAEVPPFPRD
jgi:hypothetical protein